MHSISASNMSILAMHRNMTACVNGEDQSFLLIGPSQRPCHDLTGPLSQPQWCQDAHEAKICEEPREANSEAEEGSKLDEELELAPEQGERRQDRCAHAAEDRRAHF